MDGKSAIKWTRPTLWQRLVSFFSASPYLAIERAEPWRSLD